jgi:hypothetical protein
MRNGEACLQLAVPLGWPCSDIDEWLGPLSNWRSHTLGDFRVCSVDLDTFCFLVQQPQVPATTTSSNRNFQQPQLPATATPNFPISSAIPKLITTRENTPKRP